MVTASFDVPEVKMSPIEKHYFVYSENWKVIGGEKMVSATLPDSNYYFSDQGNGV